MWEKELLNIFKAQVASKRKDAFLKIWKILKACKNKVLKQIALFFLEKQGELEYNGQMHQRNSFVLDIINTKLLKSIIVISPKKKIPTNVYTLNFVK